MFENPYGLRLLAFIALLTPVMAADSQPSPETLYQRLMDIGPHEGPLNFDRDQLTNDQEFRRWTDPRISDTDLDGTLDHLDPDPLSAVVFYFQDARLIEGDDYLYTGPAWWIDTLKQGGSWTDQGWSSDSSGDHLLIKLDSSGFTNGLYGWIELTGGPTGDLRLDILGDGDIPITEDLYGNLLQVRDAEESVFFKLPDLLMPPGQTIRLRNSSGQVQIRFARLSLSPDSEKENKAPITQTLTRYSRGVGESIPASEYQEAPREEEEYLYPNDPRRDLARKARLQRELADWLGKNARTVYVNRSTGSDLHDGRARIVETFQRGPMKTLYQAQRLNAQTLVIQVEAGKHPEDFPKDAIAGKIMIQPKGHIVVGSDRSFEHITQELNTQREVRHAEKINHEKEMAERMAAAAIAARK